MALVSCPKCGHPVSDKAYACPICQETLMRRTKAAEGAASEPVTAGETGYKPATIVSYSTHLISIAQLMMLLSAIGGGYTGFRLTPLLMMGAGRPAADSDYLIHAAIGALAGFVSVAWVAFLYIYIAQLAMCLLQIERNTRRR